MVLLEQSFETDLYDCCALEKSLDLLSMHPTEHRTIRVIHTAKLT